MTRFLHHHPFNGFNMAAVVAALWIGQAVASAAYDLGRWLCAW